MSKVYLDTPFDKWLIFFIDKNITAIRFSDTKEGAVISGELKNIMYLVFEKKDLSYFDYSFLDTSNLSEKRLKLHNFLISTKTGDVFSYSSVAETLFGDSKFRRAVAKYLSVNDFAFVVPCHRVVSKKGLGGYSKGVELKRKILIWEGVDLGGE